MFGNDVGFGFLIAIVLHWLVIKGYHIVWHLVKFTLLWIHIELFHLIVLQLNLKRPFPILQLQFRSTTLPNIRIYTYLLILLPLYLHLEMMLLSYPLHIIEDHISIVFHIFIDDALEIDFFWRNGGQLEAIFVVWVICDDPVFDSYYVL